jgi:hypothetical protein
VVGLLLNSEKESQIELMVLIFEQCAFAVDVSCAGEDRPGCEVADLKKNLMFSSEMNIHDSLIE